jgi:hypothetical protein
VQDETFPVEMDPFGDLLLVVFVNQQEMAYNDLAELGTVFDFDERVSSICRRITPLD